MIALLRNCTHGSEVATYVADEGGRRRYVKVAITPEGRAALESEIQGWDWYQRVRPTRRTPICGTLRRDAHVVRIAIEAIDGARGESAEGLARNAAVLSAAIDQYCAVWPASADGTAPMHGDLSCDNLIQAEDGLFIIDWEHFSPAAAPWGFDALHLALETLYFEMRRGGRAGPSEIGMIARYIIQLDSTRRLPRPMMDAPLAATIDFIRRRGDLWRGDLDRHPLKLPIVTLPAGDVSRIDAAIREAVGRA